MKKVRETPTSELRVPDVSKGGQTICLFSSFVGSGGSKTDVPEMETREGGLGKGMIPLGFVSRNLLFWNHYLKVLCNLDLF